MINTQEDNSSLIILRNETDKEDWKVISSLFGIPDEAIKIEITYSKVKYYMEEEV